MTARKEQPGLDFRGQLQTVPVPNEHVQRERTPDGDLLIRVELRYSPARTALARLLRLRRSKQYHLTGLGRRLYESLDGKKTVEHLVDELMTDYQLTFFEARALILQYLGNLMRKGLVVVAVPE